MTTVMTPGGPVELPPYSTGPEGLVDPRQRVVVWAQAHIPYGPGNRPAAGCPLTAVHAFAAPDQQWPSPNPYKKRRLTYLVGRPEPGTEAHTVCGVRGTLTTGMLYSTPDVILDSWRDAPVCPACVRYKKKIDKEAVQAIKGPTVWYSEDEYAELVSKRRPPVGPTLQRVADAIVAALHGEGWPEAARFVADNLPDILANRSEVRARRSSSTEG